MSLIISYTIKGIELNEDELRELSQYYEAALTSKYLCENYPDVNEDIALELGYEVHRQMRKYDFSESDAINEVLSEYRSSLNKEEGKE